MQTIGNWWLWLIFLSLVSIMLAVDLFLLKGNRAKEITTRTALAWSFTWLVLAVLFNFGLWWYLLQTTTPEIANQRSIEFFTGYLIEKALAVDNIFVFLMIFSYFSIPQCYQRRVLMYGVLGAIVMRAIMIILGTVLVSSFQWILYVFGAFLILTGIKMLWIADKSYDLSTNPVLIWLQKHLRITTTLNKEKFTVVKNGMRYFTPLFLVLVLVEVSDLIFAVDSIPAIFAITTDPFIVFTSNIFAILGLRALYFLLANIIQRFSLLKYGLALILVFVGIKMLIVEWYKIPVLWSLLVVFAILSSFTFASWLLSNKQTIATKQK